MAMSAGRDDGEPMMDMNTTPLIDVMLVLLVMFIITIPIQTHAVKIDLPPPNNNPAPPIKPTVNQLTIDGAGVIYWNSSSISMDTMKDYLQRTRLMSPEPELHFQPQPNARYEVFDKVLAEVKRSEVSKMGFVGNENYFNF